MNIKRKKKKQKVHISIRTKLILLLLLIVTGSILFISIQAYNIALGDLSTNAKDKTRTYADGTKNVIRAHLDSLKDKIILLSQNSFSTKIPEGIVLYHEYVYNSESKTYELLKSLILPEYQKLANINFLDSTQNTKQITTININKNIFILYKLKLEDRVLIALLSPNFLFNKFLKPKGLYKNFLIDETSNIFIHKAYKLNELSKLDKIKLFKSFFDSKDTYEITKEFKGTTETLIISMFKIAKTNLAVVSVISKKIVLSNANKLKTTFLVSSIFIFIISILITIIFARSISKPISILSKMTDKIAEGDFLVKIGLKSNDEIGVLAKNFENMGQTLHNREKALKEAQNALVQSEKMSAFGQISAGIAHEIKNPMTGILGHTQLAQEKLAKAKKEDPELTKSIENSLNIVEKETKRVKNIVENLMKFARQEKAIFKAEDLSHVVNDAIQFVDHQLGINLVKIKRELSEKPINVSISANQIEQVLMNIMLNAQHAMKDKEKKILTIRTMLSPKEGYGRIEIEDTGTGIPDDVKAKIFEPFFTTKEMGKGTGLGLSVSYGIIKEHKGLLDVESKLGEWTKFIIDLPLSKENTHSENISKNTTDADIDEQIRETTKPVVKKREDIKDILNKKTIELENKEEEILLTKSTEIDQKTVEQTKSRKPPLPIYKRRGIDSKIETSFERKMPIENKNIDIKVRPVKRINENKNKDILIDKEKNLKIRAPKRNS